jgi:hypothetical protein
MTTRTFFLMCFLGASTFGTCQNGPVVLTLGKVTPLRAVLRVAEVNGIPLGIVFGTHPLLCAEERSININAIDFGEACSQALAGTGYSVALESGVYVLAAPDSTVREMKALNFRFDRFSATDSTMNDAGLLLAGYIRTTIGGAQSFATASSFGPLSKTFTIHMESSTTKEIANRIVSQNGKGVWIFRPTPEPPPGSGGDSPIQIYGYKDNVAGLNQVTCVSNDHKGKGKGPE